MPASWARPSIETHRDPASWPESTPRSTPSGTRGEETTISTPITAPSILGCRLDKTQQDPRSKRAASPLPGQNRRQDRHHQALAAPRTPTSTPIVAVGPFFRRTSPLPRVSAAAASRRLSVGGPETSTLSTATGYSTAGDALAGASVGRHASVAGMAAPRQGTRTIGTSWRTTCLSSQRLRITWHLSPPGNLAPRQLSAPRRKVA